MIKLRAEPVDLCIIMAVSYTHLDVYKRQALEYTTMGAKAIAFMEKLPELSKQQRGSSGGSEH